MRRQAGKTRRKDGLWLVAQNQGVPSSTPAFAFKFHFCLDQNAKHVFPIGMLGHLLLRHILIFLQIS